MEILIVLFLPLVGFLVLGGILALVVIAVTGRSRAGTTTAQAFTAVRSHGLLIAVLAWLAAIAATAVTRVLLSAVAQPRWSSSDAVWAQPLGALLLVVPALAFLCVHAVGERGWPRPRGTVRRAQLTRRSVTDVAPRWLRALTWAWTGALAVTLAATGLTASPGGRLLVVTEHDGGLVVAGAGEPYPSWSRGLPLVVAAVALVVAAEMVLRLIARRPALLVVDAETDRAVRRLSAHRVLRLPQLAVAVTLAAMLGETGAALRQVGWSGPGTAVLVAAAVVGLAALVAAVVPAAPLPVPAPEMVGTPVGLRAGSANVRPAATQDDPDLTTTRDDADLTEPHADADPDPDPDPDPDAPHADFRPAATGEAGG